MKRKLLVLPLAIVAALPASAGVVFEVEVTDHQQKSAGVQVLEIRAQDGRLKMGRQADGEKQVPRDEVIFRGGRREMTVVNHRRRSYFVIDDEAIGGLSGQIEEAMKQLEKAMADLPEDQRKLYREAIQRNAGMGLPQEEPKVEVEELGAGGERAGYPTRRLEVQREGRKAQELWVTSWTEMAAGSEAAETLDELADFMRSMLATVSQAAGGGGPLEKPGDEMFALFDRIGGFPVVTKSYDESGELEGETLLRSVTERDLDPADFEPPAGYKRQQMLPGH